jgi:hypothetical protein
MSAVLEAAGLFFGTFMGHRAFLEVGLAALEVFDQQIGQIAGEVRRVIRSRFFGSGL